MRDFSTCAFSRSRSFPVKAVEAAVGHNHHQIAGLALAGEIVGDFLGGSESLARCGRGLAQRFRDCFRRKAVVIGKQLRRGSRGRSARASAIARASGSAS